jgi:hypothetical protein
MARHTICRLFEGDFRLIVPWFCPLEIASLGNMQILPNMPNMQMNCRWVKPKSGQTSQLVSFFGFSSTSFKVFLALFWLYSGFVPFVFPLPFLPLVFSVRFPGVGVQPVSSGDFSCSPLRVAAWRLRWHVSASWATCAGRRPGSWDISWYFDIFRIFRIWSHHELPQHRSGIWTGVFLIQSILIHVF